MEPGPLGKLAEGLAHALTLQPRVAAASFGLREHLDITLAQAFPCAASCR